MADKPFLIIAASQRTKRPKKKSFPPGESTIHRPGAQRHGERLSPRFEALQAFLNAERQRLQTDAAGIEPECVLVLETIGNVQEFARAVQRIEGLEWLAEWDDDEIEPDDDFFNTKSPGELMVGHVYLTISNQQALHQLLSLWRHFQSDRSQKFAKGLAPLKQVFELLHDIRPWDVRDRLRDTGIVDIWREDLSLGKDAIRFEAELWFRQSEGARARAFESVSRIVGQAGGRCIQSAALPDIAYHGIVIELPRESVRETVEALTQNRATELIRSNEVMFFRPTGQSAFPLAPEIESAETEQTPPPPPTRPQPTVALLDGLPIENHAFLANRLTVDDPLGWASSYPVRDRQHGTFMASLIVHGDLEGTSEPLARPIHVRPILRPDNAGQEAILDDVLPIDLVHQAVRRILVGDGDEPATAPTVRIINLSVADRYRLFFHQPSPWARLLDWLAWRHRVLFVVSTGNHLEDIELPMAPGELRELQEQARLAAVFRAVRSDMRNRRLMAPAESINSVTVGATHDDQTTIAPLGGDRFELVPRGFPQTFNGLGLGVRRAVKPDILLPGGRQFHVARPLGRNGHEVLQSVIATSPPGQKVASPATTSLGLKATCHIRGTSNATALATRAAAHSLDVIEELRASSGGDAITDEAVIPVLKALLVHGSSWGANGPIIQPMLIEPEEKPAWQIMKDRISRFLGFGTVDTTRMIGCDDHRATMIGCGALAEDESVTFAIPLPSSLSGQKVWRRLTITLAWLSPINPRSARYRSAALAYAPTENPLQVNRSDHVQHAGSRGTVQHEVFEGDKAAVFEQDSMLSIRVDCRADAGTFEGEIPFALLVSLEVAPGTKLPIYQEIRDRVLVKVPLASRGRE